MKRKSIGLPTISEYVYSVANQYGLFRTLKNIDPEYDAYGNVRFYAGGNSAVFPVVCGNDRKMLKCYFKKGPDTAEIYSYVSAHPDDLLSPAQFLGEEIYVYDALGNGAYHDVVLSDRVDGLTLETEIRRAAREFGRERFRTLSDSFDELAISLLGKEWAHGDLKPENIIVCPDGRFRLIDYDAMFIPPFAGAGTFELGTPPYQHPLRDEKFFCKSLDDYSIAMISVSLRALSLDMRLFVKYNEADNIILNPHQIIEGSSKAYDEILGLFSSAGDHSSYRLAMTLCSPSPEIDDLAALLTTRSDIYSIPLGRVTVAAEQAAKYDTERMPELFCRDGLWGFADSSGTEIIPAVYEEATGFSEGLAAVLLHGIWHYIEPSGKVAINCGRFQSVKPFSEGLAAVLENGLWGYIRPDGRTFLKPQYETAGSFRDNLALVKTGGRYGFIDPQGKLVVDAIYEYATGFRNGRATVILDGDSFEIGPDGQKL